MFAVVTTGHGGYDRLERRCVPVPDVGADDVLLRVLSAGVNNTDINLRVGWYSKDVTRDTATQAYASSTARSVTAAGGARAHSR